MYEVRQRGVGGGKGKWFKKEPPTGTILEWSAASGGSRAQGLVVRSELAQRDSVGPGRRLEDRWGKSVAHEKQGEGL